MGSPAQLSKENKLDFPGTNAEALLFAIKGSLQCNHLPSDEIIKLLEDFSPVAFVFEDGSWGPEHDMCILMAEDFGNRKYAVLIEMEDTTGHGCQCDATLTFHDSLDEAMLLGVTRDYRKEIASQIDWNKKGEE